MRALFALQPVWLQREKYVHIPQDLTCAILLLAMQKYGACVFSMGHITGSLARARRQYRFQVYSAIAYYWGP